MGRLSRQKGSAFEREVAKVLSQWWYGRPDALRRTPLSGGWSKDHGTASDICAPIGDEPFPFAVECKHRESWTFNSLFDKVDGGDVGRWWRKLVDVDLPGQAKALRRPCEPILVFCADRGVRYVILRRTSWLLLGQPKPCVILDLPAVEGVMVKLATLVQTDPSNLKEATCEN